MLNSWELADMRATFLASCDKVCEVHDPGPTTTGPGGEEPGEVVITNRACRVMDLVGTEREVGGRLTGIADVMILLATGPLVDWDAEIVVDGAVYGVVRVAADSTQPVAVRVYAQRTT